MKTGIHTSHAAAAFLLGLLGALAGCATTAVRQSTTEDFRQVASTEQPEAGVERPVPVHTVPPEYPFDLKRRGIEGEVTLHCLVDEAGRVSDATVATATDRELGPPAVAALRQWTFRPGRRDGQIVPMRVSIPLRFTLE